MDSSSLNYSKKEELNERLIQLIREHPTLYDKSSGLFSNRYVKDKAWGDVSKAMGLSVLEVKKIWRGLRDTFAKEQRTRMLPSGSGCVRQPTWKHYTSMSFMQNMHHSRETTSNIPDEDMFASPSVDANSSSCSLDSSSIGIGNANKRARERVRGRNELQETAAHVLRSAQNKFSEEVVACKANAREPGPAEKMFAAVEQQLDQQKFSYEFLLRVQSRLFQIISEEIQNN